MTQSYKANKTENQKEDNIKEGLIEVYFRQKKGPIQN